MLLLPKKLGITQLSPDLFVLAHKQIRRCFVIPPPFLSQRVGRLCRLVATGVPPLIRITEYSGGLLEVLDERN
jgi:hypothetical protein